MAEEKKLVRWSKTAVTDVGTELLTEYVPGHHHRVRLCQHPRG